MRSSEAAIVLNVRSNSPTSPGAILIQAFRTGRRRRFVPPRRRFGARALRLRGSGTALPRGSRAAPRSSPIPPTSSELRVVARARSLRASLNAVSVSRKTFELSANRLDLRPSARIRRDVWRRLRVPPQEVHDPNRVSAEVVLDVPLDGERATVLHRAVLREIDERGDRARIQPPGPGSRDRGSACPA